MPSDRRRSDNTINWLICSDIICFHDTTSTPGKRFISNAIFLVRKLRFKLVSFNQCSLCTNQCNMITDDWIGHQGGRWENIPVLHAIFWLLMADCWGKARNIDSFIDDNHYCYCCCMLTNINLQLAVVCRQVDRTQWNVNRASPAAGCYWGPFVRCVL